MLSDEKDFSSALQALEHHNLRAQLALFNRLHIALRASLNHEDLLEIILAVLVSELGLGFDHAYFLEYDEKAEVYRGRRAIGTLDHDQHRAIRQRIADEHRWLAMRIERFAAEPTKPSEDIETSAGLQDLQDNAFWIDTVQTYSIDQELNEKLRAVELPCSRGSNQRLLCRIALSHHCIVIDGESLPAALDDLVMKPAIAAPLRTRHGLYGILIADLGFSEERLIPQGLATLFEWFIVQASVALENALLFGQKQQAFEQLQAIESIKSAFLSTISHELRTPLTTISGFTQALLQNRAGALNDEQREFLNRIHRQTTHLSHMVNDLLELAEENAEAFSEQSLKPVDPLAALMAVVPRLERRRASKQAVIEPSITGKVPFVMATEHIMERVLFHLLDNAVKFSPRKSRVQVRFLTRGRRLRIEIQDFGIGISPEDLKKIFDGFYQVDHQLSRTYEGLGIGLVLTKKLLMAIGGAIDVKSKLGEGTTVAIELRIPTEERLAHAS